VAAPIPKGELVPLAADYPFLDFLWSMLLVFLWIAWLFLLFRILMDVFRRDVSGWKKAMWSVFLILIPFVGVLAYVIVNGADMTKRDIEQARAQQAQFDDYVRQTAGSGGGGGAAAEIAKAKELLDSGALTQEEFDQIKRKALG
jgi:hypothetical protein